MKYIKHIILTAMAVVVMTGAWAQTSPEKQPNGSWQFTMPNANQLLEVEYEPWTLTLSHNAGHGTVELLRPGSSAAVGTAENAFKYCFDCQRRPGYPTAGTNVTNNLYGFKKPYVGLNGVGVPNDSVGPWKLEYVGKYSHSEYNFSVSDIRHTYGLNSDEDVPIFLLYQWDGSQYQPVVYGVACAYSNLQNAEDHTLLFVAEGHWGCYLSNKYHSEDLSISFDEDLSTGLPNFVTAATPALPDGVVDNHDGTYSVAPGTTVTIEAIANTAEHYYFNNWTNEDGDEYTEGVTTPSGAKPATSLLTFTVTGDTTVRGNFRIDTFDLTLSTNNANMGHIDIGGQQYESKDTVMTDQQHIDVTAIPEPGHYFVNWTNENGQVVSTSVTLNWMATADMTFTANFAAYATLQVASNNTAWGTVGEPQVGAGNTDHVMTLYDENESASNHMVPAYTCWFDASTKSQYIIPASKMADAKGGTISSIQYYTQDPVSWTSGAVDIYLKEVTYSTLSSMEDKGSCTVVYTGQLTFENGGVTITFTNPYPYNGGNLLVGLENEAAGYNCGIQFLGEDAPGASMSGFGSNFQQQDFLPQCTFTYQPSGVKVNPNGGYYIIPGNEVTVTATPETDYHLVNWTDEDNNVMGTDAQLTFTITGDTTAMANFAGNLYTISDIPQGWTVTANGTTVTVTNGTAEIAENAEVVLNPTTNVNLVRNVTLTGSYSIVQQSNGTWKFTMPAANTSVEVVYWIEPGLAYSAARDTAFLDIPNHTFPTLTNSHNLDVHYGSSNTSVATVNTDGSVTVLTYGQTVIYAVHDQSETDGYGYDSVFYTLTVPVAMVTTSDNVTTYYHQFNTAASSWMGNNNSTMTMLADVNYNSTNSNLTISDKALTLDLNGHGITFKGHAFSINYNTAALTIVDTTTIITHYYTIHNDLARMVDEATYNASSDTKGTFTGGYITGGNDWNTSSITLTNESRLDMYGGTIIGTSTLGSGQSGGGVNIQTRSTFRMYGGNIIGNRSVHGGGVSVNGGTMEFYGGVISQNFASDGGGGVYVYGSSSKLIMSGGTIANNKARWGGAIQASSGGSVTITGGTFSNNPATGTTAKGGALTNYDANNNATATFNISGAPVFSGNMCNNEANDVYLVGNVKLNIPDTTTLSNTTPIIIDMATPGVFTNGLSGHGDASKFTSGNAAYAVTLTTDQEAQLSRLYTLTLATNDNTMGTVTLVGTPAGVTDNNDGTYTVIDGTQVTVSATVTAIPAENFHLVNWTDENSNVMGTDAQITLTITGDTTVQGNFERDFEGSGTEDDPYLIPSKEKWNLLATRVGAGNSYEGKYFRQTADINQTNLHRVGNGYPFSGIYDGQGHSIPLAMPFYFVDGATIKNLHITGWGGGFKFDAGLIYRLNQSDKTTNIINCRSSVEIKSGVQHDFDGTHGGFVGVTRASINFIGCVFDGKFVGQYGPYCRSNGGFIGWTDTSASVHFKDCIFAPEIVSMGDSLSCTFSRARKDTSLHFTNCYYTQAYGTEQGKQMDSITAGEYVTSLAFAGIETVYNVSGITAYANNMGLKYGDKFYAGNGDVVELSLSHADRTADGFSFNSYSASNGGIINGTTLTMPDTSTVISANYNSTTPTTPGLTPEGEVTVLGNKFVDEHGQIVGSPRITEHGEFIDYGNSPQPVHLIGKFSVSSTQKVYFSPANLQYTRTSTSVDWSTGTWSFLAHQYSSVETAANPYCTENYGDKTAVGLFGWGTWGEGKTPNITSTSNANYTWSTDFQGTLGGYSDWRTLTKDEWTYLLTTRATGVTVNSTNNARYTLATINTGTSMVKGMIIFPDGFTGNNTDGVTWGTINAASNYTTTCTTAGWNALESANCLFLPATGWRAKNMDNGDGSRVEGINTWSYYWTKDSYSTSDGYMLGFDGQNVKPSDHAEHRFGFSVRLVRNAE